MGTFNDLFARLDPDSGVRGEQFEHVCKWFLDNDPHYADLFTNVWLWDESPFDWGKDKGTDLVAQDKYGKLWAIQSKAYKNTRSVTKAGIDSFLSDSSRAEIDHRLLIATTNRIGDNAEDTIDIQEKGVSVVRLSDLEGAEVQWPESLLDLIAIQPEPNEPRDYQIEAINAVVDGFAERDRGQLIMACGTGKTLTALFIKENLAAERTLVLVPSLSLVKQTVREWTANRREPFEYMAVCSDESVDNKYDRILLRVSELRTPVETDPVKIQEFLRRSGPRVVFSTYHSSPQIAEAFKLGGVADFDLIVADEAHRTIGHTSRAFATVLKSAEIKAKRRLFMTATPRDFTQRVKGVVDEVDGECASMDDETIYGPVFHKLGFTEAIRRKLLTDYRLLIVCVDDFFYKDWVENGRFVSVDGKEVNARDLAAHIGLAKAMRDHDIRRAITFHTRIAGASGFAREFPHVIDWMPADQRPSGEIMSHHVSGKMNAGQRENALRRLRNIDDGQRAILANARVLTEGVDVPTLDGVAFIDPKQAETDIIQAVGRAIRLAPDKHLGTIVIPVFIEPGEDAEAALDDSSFKTVWDVVKALRSHDEELGQALDNIRIELGRRKKARHPSEKIEIDLTLAPSVNTDFSDAIDLHMVEMATAPWMQWFGMVLQFMEDNDGACPSVDCEVDGAKLGRWIVNQRARASQLSPEQWKLLNDLPGWFWNVHESKWEEPFRLLLKYIEINGHAAIGSDVVFEGYALGRWCAIQRRDGKNGKLLPERYDRLDAIPEWLWGLEEAKWERGFNGVLQFKATHGRLPRQQESNEDAQGTLNVGKWLHFQRTRKNQGKLEPERIERLDQLLNDSEAWSPSEAKWQKGYGYLKAFADEYGHVRVPMGYVVDGVVGRFNLRDWYTNNRAKIDKLSPERQSLLKALPGWGGHSHDKKWEVGFGHAVNQLKLKGSIKRGDEIDGYRIGQWADVQRQERRERRLSKDRIKRLSVLKGWDWNPPKGVKAPTARHDVLWEVGFDHAQRHVSLGGVLGDIIQTYVTKDEFRYVLGRWMYRQQVALKAGKMPTERIARLDAIDRSWRKGLK